MKNQMVRAMIGLSLTLSIFSPAILAQEAQNPDNPSLGDLARQERERKKNQTPAKTVLTNDGGATPSPSAGQGQPSAAPGNPAGATGLNCTAPCLVAFPVAELGGMDRNVLLTHLQNHSLNMDFSADGKRLALAQYLGAERSLGLVSIREVQTGREIQRIRTSLHSVTNVQFSPNGKILATTGSTLKERVLFGPYTKLPEAAAQDGGLTVLWDVDDGHPIRTLDADPFTATALAFSPDGRTIVTGGETGALRIWDTATGRQLQALASPARDYVTLQKEGWSEVDALAFSPDGRWLAVADGGIEIWEVQTGGKAKTISVNFHPITPLAKVSMVFGRDGRWLMANGQIVDAASGSLVGKVEEPWAAEPILMNSDGSWGVWFELTEPVVKVSAPFGPIAYSLQGHTDLVIALALSPDGNLLASWGMDDTVRIWDTRVMTEKVAEESEKYKARQTAAAAEQAVEETNKNAKLKQATTLLASAGLSPEEERVAAFVSDLASGMAILKASNCPVTTKDFVSLDAIAALLCQAKSTACGSCLKGSPSPDEWTHDPNYAYQERLTATGGDAIALPKKPGAASFYSDGKNTYFSRAGQASPQSTLLGDAGSVAEAVLRKVKQQVVEANEDYKARQVEEAARRAEEERKSAKPKQATAKVVLTNDGSTAPGPPAGQQPLSGAAVTSQVSPVDCLRTLNTAAITYSSTFNLGFPTRLSAFGPSKDPGTPPTAAAAGLIDETLASGTKGGYVFTYSAGEKDASGRVNTYTIRADPLPPTAGQKHYFTDGSGVIRKENDKPANESSPPISMSDVEAAWGNQVDEVAARLTSAERLSPEEKRAASGVLWAGFSPACPITTEGFVPLREFIALVCQAKSDTCKATCAEAKSVPDPLDRDPAYSYQLHGTAEGGEAIAVPKKPGLANFYSDGKDVYYSREGQASKQSTLLGDSEIVQTALAMAAADSMTKAGLSPGEKAEAAKVAGVASNLLLMKAQQCPITTQDFVSPAALNGLICQSKSDACGACNHNSSASEPSGHGPIYSYQEHVTAGGGEVIAVPNIPGLPNFYSDGESIYSSWTGRASRQSILLGNLFSVEEATRIGGRSGQVRDAVASVKDKQAQARMASEKLSPEEKDGGLAVSLLAIGGLALKLANCPLTTQGFIGVPAIHNLVCPETSPPCGRCGDEETKLLESVAQDPNYSYQMRLTALDGEVIAVPKKPGLASFYSDGENIYFSRAGQASKQSTMLSDAGSFFRGVMMNPK